MDDGFAVVTLGINGAIELGLLSFDDPRELARVEIFAGDWTPIGMSVLDRGDGMEIAVAASNADVVEVRTFDTASGQKRDDFAFLDADAAARGLFVGDTSGQGHASIGVLGSNASGDIWLEQRATADGEMLAVLTTQSVQPPPPPPPPPPPDEIGLRGGTGAMGLWLLLFGACCFYRQKHRPGRNRPHGRSV
jgi:hypothetical protein